MRNIFKAILILAAGAMVFSGCIKETFPQSNAATSEQVGASSTALAGAMSGLSAQLVQSYPVWGSTEQYEPDMGFPMFLMVFTELMGDIYPGGSEPGYDWFRSWNVCKGMSETSQQAYISWRALYMFVKSANDIIASVDEENASDLQLGYAGMAYAYRAFWYYYLMNLYEPVANEYTDVTDVLGLTVPIITEKTLEADGKNNPRVPHDEMVAFILSDLDKAERYLSKYTPDSRMYPSLAVAYGIKAKVYMSDGQYANAAKYARMAIDSFSGSPMTEAEWFNLNSGFTKANKAWMWYTTYSAESMGNLCNWVGWISAEADWGYSSLTKPMIDRNLYDRIPATDWRKHSWLDPQKYDYFNYQTIRGKDWIEAAPAYLSLKFRCVDGDYETYTIGGLADVPMMRVEEMYYIEAEAKGLQNLGDGIAALNAFVKAHRQPDYECTAATVEEFEDEILFQKKVEFWGEGVAFFDAKRMRAGTLQSYPGTNAPTDEFKLNCNGIKPNWNFVIPQSEVNNNIALDGFNNPDPTSTVDPDLNN